MVSLGTVWLLQIAAIVMWGTMYIPARKYETHDGIMFQWYMSSGILFTALIIHYFLPSDNNLPTSSNFPIYTEGFVGGSLWALANILVVPTVKLLGLGVGFTLYHSINLLMG